MCILQLRSVQLMLTVSEGTWAKAMYMGLQQRMVCNPCRRSLREAGWQWQSGWDGLLR